MEHRAIVKYTIDRKTGETIAAEVVGSKEVDAEFDRPLVKLLYDRLPEEIKRPKTA
jgi:hypothetical protein